MGDLCFTGPDPIDVECQCPDCRDARRKHYPKLMLFREAQERPPANALEIIARNKPDLDEWGKA